MTGALFNSTTTRSFAQPWLSSARWDSVLILLPAFISSGVALMFHRALNGNQQLPPWAWICFVLLVDVAHVYSTLFRTYFNNEAYEKHKGLLFAIPCGCWVVGAFLYSIHYLLFWKALAYLAVFHFIRQQYGFTALYSRTEPVEFEKFKQLDQWIIYLATLYPLLYWHANLPRNFNWFVDGDFFESIPPAAVEAGLALYVIVGILYVAKEIYLLKATGFFNIPKNLIIGGTAFSWWVGIVALNSDMAFTMTNVLSHGIPYMALIWLNHRARTNDISMKAPANSFLRLRQLSLTFVPLFLAVLFLLAYMEEGLWDGLVWREHLSFFGLFAGLPEIRDAAILAILVPFLSLPQSTHYVLDGFIWRMKDKSSEWSEPARAQP